jgi:hypothetical protein
MPADKHGLECLLGKQAPTASIGDYLAFIRLCLDDSNTLLFEKQNGPDLVVWNQITGITLDRYLNSIKIVEA